MSSSTTKDALSQHPLHQIPFSGAVKGDNLTSVTGGGPAVLVFQYGSNCLESEINSKERLCGDAKFTAIAQTVEDFELAFDVQRH